MVDKSDASCPTHTILHFMVHHQTALYLSDIPIYLQPLDLKVAD